MINVEHIEDWRGKDVVDPEGATLGKLQEVYYDKATQTPILLAIRHGLLSRKVTMIPVDGAKVGPDYVRVAHDRSTVDAAPEGVQEPPPNADELDTIGEDLRLPPSQRESLDA